MIIRTINQYGGQLTHSTQGIKLMHYITEPTVYLIGKSMVVESELQKFLDKNKISGWTTDAPSAGEKLAEVAGRVCYMSFKQPRPGGNKAYIDHIKDVGHGCYDGLTEVLTKTGWKYWPDVIESDELATINKDTFEISYELPNRLIKYNWLGEMYKVDSEQVDLLVTPDHKMLVCPTTTQEGRKKDKYSLLPISEINNKSHAYLKNGDWNSGNNNFLNDSINKPYIMSLLGFSIGDGNISDRSNQIKFHLTKERKIIYLRNLCNSLLIDGFTLKEDIDNTRYTVSFPDKFKQLFKSIYDLNQEKQIPYEALFATKNLLLSLLDGLLQSDGHHSETGDTFDTTSKKLADQFQQLCLHVGLASNVVYTYSKEKRITSFGDKPLTRLSVIRRSLKPVVNKFSGSDGKTYKIDNWEGDVYCAEVPNNTLYVRRNGIPVWSGNSVLEHATYTLLCEGISRSVSHEFVRHRVGMSPSQLSQRYFDGSETEFCIPPSLAVEVKLAIASSYVEEAALESELEAYVTLGYNPSFDKYLYDYVIEHGVAQTIKAIEAGQAWINSVEAARIDYINLTDYLASLPNELKGTEKRKFARQAARSVLPNATETKIVMTGNIRSWRNFIELRANRHADPEIRALGYAVWKKLVQESPNAFGDYIEEQLPDGSFELTVKNRKV